MSVCTDKYDIYIYSIYNISMGESFWSVSEEASSGALEYFNRPLNFVLYQTLSRGHIMCFVSPPRPPICPLAPVLSQGVRKRQRPELQSQVSDQWGVK